MSALKDDFLQSFKRQKLVLLADLGFVLTIAFWAIEADHLWTFELRWFCAVGVVLLTIVLLAFMILLDLLIAKYRENEILARSKQEFVIPKVISVHVYGADNFALIVGPTNIFFDKALVSIFQTKLVGGNDLEIEIGIGHVSNIQLNGLVQIVPLMKHETAKSIWADIQRNDQTILTSISCKPSVSFNLVDLRLPDDTATN